MSFQNYTTSQKTVQNYFCPNFVKFPPSGTVVVKRISLCEVFGCRNSGLWNRGCLPCLLAWPLWFMSLLCMRASSTRWNEVCHTASFAVQELLRAWQQGSINHDTITVCWHFVCFVIVQLTNCVWNFVIAAVCECFDVSGWLTVIDSRNPSCK